MLDHSGLGIAVFNGEQGGTKNALDYTEKPTFPALQSTAHSHKFAGPWKRGPLLFPKKEETAQ